MITQCNTELFFQFQILKFFVGKYCSEWKVIHCYCPESLSSPACAVSVASLHPPSAAIPRLLSSSLRHLISAPAIIEVKLVFIGPLRNYTATPRTSLYYKNTVKHRVVQVVSPDCVLRNTPRTDLTGVWSESKESQTVRQLTEIQSQVRSQTWGWEDVDIFAKYIWWFNIQITHIK